MDANLDKKSIDECAAEWFLRRQSGFSSAEQKIFERWIEESEAHKKAFDDIAKVWIQLDGLAKINVKKPCNNSSFSPLKASIAAAVCCVALVFYWRAQKAPLYEESMVNPVGSVSSLVLPDGTKLFADSNTTVGIKYFKDSREIILGGGQISIEVFKDKDRPLSVKAGELKTVVTGTAFNVKFVDGRISTVVKEGSVRVEKKTAENYTLVATLKANESFVCEEGKGCVKAPKIASEIDSWRGGRVSFDDEPLSTAVAEFARYGYSDIVVCDKNIASKKISGSFEISKAPVFATMLPSVIGCEIEKKNGKIYVKSQK